MGEWCILDFDAFDAAPERVGPLVAPFLASPSGDDVADAIYELGVADYQPARLQIEALLDSPDWRVAWQAARTLGWMGDRQAIPKLEAMAAGHWMPGVRRMARRSADALLAGGRLPRSREPGIDSPFADDMGEARSEVPNCPDEEWFWQGQPLPKTWAGYRLDIEGGQLVGSDGGEWGGGVSWKRKGGRFVSMLSNDNAYALLATDRGFLVAAGMVHLTGNSGYIARLRPDGRGGWTTSLVLVLPTAPYRLTTLGPGTYVAFTYSGPVIFNDKGVLGMGECKPR